jgi:hypothetical protein
MYIKPKTAPVIPDLIKIGETIIPVHNIKEDNFVSGTGVIFLSPCLYIFRKRMIVYDANWKLTKMKLTW